MAPERVKFKIAINNMGISLIELRHYNVILKALAGFL